MIRKPRGMDILKQIFRSKEQEARRKLMAWIFGHIDLRPADQVLEIGFGLGELLQMAAKNVTKGKIVGVEISAAMVKAATELNAKAISAGRMEIIEADANNLPYENDHFDKVFALNVVYFWTDLTKTVNELCRVIKPGGIIALYLAPRILLEDMQKYRFGHFTMHEPDDVVKTLQQLGFNPIVVEETESHKGTVHCVIGVQT